MQQSKAEYDRHRAFLVGESQDQTHPQVTAREMQRWEQEWQRMAGAERANIT